MATIYIVTGSVMGTADSVASAARLALKDQGHTVEIIDPAKYTQATDAASKDSIILVITSNTGMGDIPANILPFYQHLTGDFPNIAGRRYGVVTLGDSSYPNFAQTGSTFDHALSDIGASRIGDIKVFDALEVEDYNAEATTWAQQWSQLI